MLILNITSSKFPLKSLKLVLLDKSRDGQVSDFFTQVKSQSFFENFKSSQVKSRPLFENFKSSQIKSCLRNSQVEVKIQVKSSLFSLEINQIDYKPSQVSILFIFIKFYLFIRRLTCNAFILFDKER